MKHLPSWRNILSSEGDLDESKGPDLWVLKLGQENPGLWLTIFR
jgi:hypothetical protein